MTNEVSHEVSHEITLRDISRNLTHEQIKDIIKMYGEVYDKPVVITNHYLTNRAKVRNILNKLGWNEPINYESIMNFLNEIKNDLIDWTIEDKIKDEFDVSMEQSSGNQRFLDDTTYDTTYDNTYESFINESEEIEKLRAEIDKINKLEVEVQNRKRELMNELNNKLVPLPPIPHFNISDIPDINELKPKDINKVILKPLTKSIINVKHTQSEYDNAEALIHLKSSDKPAYETTIYNENELEILEINEPHDFDNCYIVYVENERQMKYSELDVDKKNINNEPVQLYYINKNLHDFDKIFSIIEKIYDVESKPYKITFCVGGIYETEVNDSTFTYAYKEPNYNESKRQIPITIHTKEDLNILMCYINDYMYDIHELTKTSREKLCWITSICFNVSRCHKINYVNKQWLPIEIINSRFIIIM